MHWQDNKITYLYLIKVEEKDPNTKDTWVEYSVKWIYIAIGEETDIQINVKPTTKRDKSILLHRLLHRDNAKDTFSEAARVLIRKLFNRK